MFFHRCRRPSPAVLVALLALVAAMTGTASGPAQAAGPQQQHSWTKLVDRPIRASQLGLPASTSAERLARAALRESAKRLKLRGSLRGLRLLSEVRAPKPADGRDLRTVRFHQTVGGLRVLYSKIDVAVVDRSVTSINATVVPVRSPRLRGAERVSAARARAIARRRIAGSNSALAAQAIAYAGKPTRPGAARRAWVVQVTPRTGAADGDQEISWCVVIDAQAGTVLDVWKGVAARPDAARSAPAAGTAQAAETNLAKIRDANLVPGVDGTTTFQLATAGNPFLYTADTDFEVITHNFNPGGVLPEANKTQKDLQTVPRHMCLARGFCGRDGGFDGTFNQFSVTVRVPAQTNPPKSDRGTRYRHSDQRVFVAASDSGSSDILAHELGHLMDLTYAEDRVSNIFADEVEEALADMFAMDFDRDDSTLGETEPRDFVGIPRINYANPSTITNPIEKEPYPSHHSQFKCARTDPHFNSTILSHFYFRFAQKVGHNTAGAVLHRVSSTLGPSPGELGLRDGFIQRAGELFGTSTRNAAVAAWSEVGLQPGNVAPAQGKGC